MDGLLINQSYQQGNSMTRERRQADMEKAKDVFDIREQGKRDLKTATTENAGVRQQQRVSEGMAGVESVYKTGTSGIQTYNDWAGSKSTGDFLTKQFNQSLVGQGVTSGKNAVQSFNDRRAGAQMDAEDRENPLPSSDVAGEGAGEGVGDVRVAEGATGSLPPRGVSANVDVSAQRPREMMPTPEQRLTDQTASLSADGKDSSFLEKSVGEAKTILNNPLTKGSMKVLGNIQGGEDISDFFTDKKAFDAVGAGKGAGWDHWGHILDAWGTVADVAGIFIPGAEELGAALNLAGTVASDVGGDKTAKQNLTDSRNKTTASVHKEQSEAGAPLPTNLGSAGLIASASSHVSTGVGSSTF